MNHLYINFWHQQIEIDYLLIIHLFSDYAIYNCTHATDHTKNKGGTVLLS